MNPINKYSYFLMNQFSKLGKIFNKETGEMAKRDPYKDIKMLSHRIRINNPEIIDGGASLGVTIEIFKSFFPAATINAFEPVPESYEIIKNKFYNFNNIHIHKIAIGHNNEDKIFHVNKKKSTSSFLTSGDKARDYFGNILNRNKNISVKCNSLDYLVENKIIPQPDIIKLDLQGYELNALKGAKRILGKTKIIYSEVEFIRLYDKQPLFEDIALYLRRNNYYLFNLYNLLTHADGQLSYGDALFINNKYYT